MTQLSTHLSTVYSVVLVKLRLRNLGSLLKVLITNWVDIENFDKTRVPYFYYKNRICDLHRSH